MTTTLRTNALCTGSDVVELLGNYKDQFVGVDDSYSELNAAINDADDDIYRDYDNPLVRTDFLLRSGTYIYEFDKTRQTTYRLDRVIVRGNNNVRYPLTNAGNVIVENVTISGDNVLVGGSDAHLVADEFLVDLDANVIVISPTTASNLQSLYCETDYVPRSYHILSKNKAALTLIEERAIVSGDQTENAQVLRLNKRIEKIEKSLMPFDVIDSGVSRDKNLSDPRNRRDHIIQHRFYEY